MRGFQARLASPVEYVPHTRLQPYGTSPYEFGVQALPKTAVRSPGDKADSFRASKHGLHSYGMLDGSFRTGVSPGDSTCFPNS